MIPTSPEDREQLVALLERVARHDQAALAVLYDRTSPILYGLLLRMLGDPEPAQEALQDTYLRVWSRADAYDDVRGEPIAWLIGIARYRGLEMLRKRRAAVVDDETVEMEADLLPGPEELSMERQDLERLVRCLRDLPEAQRKCLLLAYYQGYSHGELGRMLGVPVGTVKAWLRRGLIRLREDLGSGDD